MGYYTKYAIRIKNKYNTESNLKKLCRFIKLVSGYTFDLEGSILIDSYCGIIYWNDFDREKDMIIISKLLPKLEIEICGKGENPGDVWCYLYRNGNRYQGGDSFLKKGYELGFSDETDSNNCSVISCSSSDEDKSNDEEEKDEKGD